MVMMPIQIMPEGVLIPLYYLQNAHEFELEVVDGHLLVRPKTNGQPVETSWLTDPTAMVGHEQPLVSTDELSSRYPWIGIVQTGNRNASVEVEEILAEEIDIRAGWTTKQ